MIPTHLVLLKRPDGGLFVEHAPVRTIALRRDFENQDIDEFRARWGKEEGEAKFFRDAKETGRVIRKGNMLVFNGACSLWQYALNNGTATANQAFPTPTLLTNANSYMYVSDGGISISGQQIAGTCSVNSGSASLTSSTSNPANLVIGNYIVIQQDTSSGIYLITAGSGTSWTISPVYGAGTNASGSSYFYIPPSTHSQTAIQGTAGSNVANQVADSTFPSCLSTAQFNSITGASGTPIALTVSGADISQNDICHVVEVLGNTNANGVWVAGSGTTASNIVLSGSVAGSAYTSGGLVTKRSVLVMQATFGTSAAIFQWNAWSMYNGNGSNKIMINNKIIGLGTKSGSTSSSLKVGLAIG